MGSSDHPTGLNALARVLKKPEVLEGRPAKLDSGIIETTRSQQDRPLRPPELTCSARNQSSLLGRAEYGPVEGGLGPLPRIVKKPVIVELGADELDGEPYPWSVRVLVFHPRGQDDRGRTLKRPQTSDARTPGPRMHQDPALHSRHRLKSVVAVQLQ